LQPLSAFNAFGHLVITPDGEALAAAAAENNLPPTSYTRVVRVDLSTKKTLPEIAVAEGIDDIAVNGQLQGGTLYDARRPQDEQPHPARLRPCHPAARPRTRPATRWR